VVARVASGVGLDGARVVEEAQAPEAKARLRRQTEAALAEGVFGVPTMLVGGELFWGYDDLPWLERFLAGDDPLADTPRPAAPSAPRASAVRRRFREAGS
jgi:2-hydroxychromene-2-carboxylate isomerase